MSEDVRKAIERAEHLNDTEEAEPFYKWAHRVDQWIANDLPRLRKGFEAATEREGRLREENEMLREVARHVAAFRPTLDTVILAKKVLDHSSPSHPDEEERE